MGVDVQSRRRIAAKRRGKRASSERDRNTVERITVSLPTALARDLDAMVASEGFINRSQAVADFVHRALVTSQSAGGADVMVGTITLFYDHTVGRLQQRLAELQRENIDEVISSLHVHLTMDKTLEVVLVQGPAPKLRALANQMSKLRGVVSGHLQLAAAIIPPLHPLKA